MCAFVGWCFFFSSRRRHTRCALVTGVQTCALPIYSGMPAARIPVRWEVAEDAACTRIVRSGETLAMPELGHSVHVEVAGLQPHRPYWYRFAVAGSDVSPVGMARKIGRAHV